MAAVVAVGTAQRKGDQITFSVSRFLKGEPGTRTLTFPAKERVQSTSGSKEPVYYTGPPEGFEKGEPCIVFLRSEGEGAARRVTLLHAFLQRAEFEQNVKDVVQLDALPDEDSKCRLLVDFVIGGGASQYYARDELSQLYDKEGYLELFEEIAGNPDSRSWFVQLLCQIEGKKALARMMQVLESDPPDMQLLAIAALSQLDPGNDEVSKALVPFLKHEDPMLRAQTVVALGERDYLEVFPQIALALSDPNPQVRGAAAAWPWNDEKYQTPEAISQLRKLTSDKDLSVRLNAGDALIGAGDTTSFYSLWWMSLSDPESYVRRSLPLDILLESRPVSTFLMLIWPTALAFAVAVRIRRRRKVKRPMLPAASLLIGYALGAGIGFCLGEYRTSNPLIHAVFLTPAVTVPLCLLSFEIVALACSRKKMPSESAEPATA